VIVMNFKHPETTGFYDRDALSSSFLSTIIEIPFSFFNVESEIMHES